MGVGFREKEKKKGTGLLVTDANRCSLPLSYGWKLSITDELGRGRQGMRLVSSRRGHSVLGTISDNVCISGHGGPFYLE